MTIDRTEQLIRDVFADEAARAVDSREVLADRPRARRRAGVRARARDRGRRGRRRRGRGVRGARGVPAQRAHRPGQRSRGRGTDERAGRRRSTRAGTTDSIVLAQVTADGSVSLVSLPSDTWVGARQQRDQAEPGLLGVRRRTPCSPPSAT